MFDQKYVISVFFVLIALLLTLNYKEKTSVSILFFFIPILAAPFKESSFYFVLGLNAFIIWGIWLGHLFNKSNLRTKDFNWKVYSPKVTVLYYFLIAGILLVLINPNLNTILFAHHEPLSSTINFSFYIITLILFLKIMINYRYDYEFQDKLKVIFITTSFLQVAVFLISFTRYGHLLPAYLITTQGDYSTILRYPGLLGDYELIDDYVMIVLAFCTIFLFNKKYMLLSIFGIFSSIMLGILSGTRSFIVISIIFLGLLYILQLKSIKLKIVIPRIFILIFILLLWGLASVYFADYTNIFTRSAKALQLLSERSDFERVTNRSLIEAIPNLINSSGVLGNGSLLISAINKDEMVSHNLYFAMYANYGIIGLYFILFLFISSLRKLYRLIKKAKINSIKLEGIVYFSVLFSLFINGFKISTIRNIATILSYAVLFVFIKFLMLRDQAYEKP